MGLFGEKKSGEDNSVPVDKVLALKKQNLTNNQIVEALQREGYSITKIFDAMSQAEMSENANPNVAQPLGTIANPVQPQIPSFQEYQNTQQNPVTNQQQPQMAPPMNQEVMQQQYPNYQAYPVQPAFDENELNEKIEEVTEAIIEEKWHDFVETIEKIIEWKNAMQEKFDKFENELDFLKQEFDKIHTALIKKIDQYDKGMSNVGAQLKAMEMVFKDILPKFTENVNLLSDYAQKVKEKRKS